MQEKKCEFPLSKLEIVLSAALTPVIYIGSVMLIFGREHNLPWRMISVGIAVTLVLGFDVIWIILMIFLPLKSTRAKMLLTLSVLTLSAIILTDLYLIYTWHKMW